MEKIRLIDWITQRSIETFGLTKEAPYDNEHKQILINEIRSHSYMICGDAHQIEAIPLFNDGYLLLSMRTWAELMNEAADNGAFGEQAFYMSQGCPLKDRLPGVIDLCEM